MKTIEEVFLESRETIEKGMQEALDSVMGKWYVEYLPYVQTDTEMNVMSETRRVLERFFKDENTEQDLADIPVLKEYTGKEARALLLKEHRELLEILIVKDLLEEIESLRCSLRHAYGTAY